MAILQLILLLPFALLGQLIIGNALLDQIAQKKALQISDATAFSLICVAIAMFLFHRFIRISLDETTNDLRWNTRAAFKVSLITLLVLFASFIGVHLIVPLGFEFDLRFDRLFGYFSIAAFVAVSEEIIFRSVLQKSISERYGFSIALLVSSILFGAIHIFNPNGTALTTLFIAIGPGVFLGTMYERHGGLFSSVAAHGVWNFVILSMGCTLSGLANAENSVGQQGAADWLTGGGFGIEGSVITVIVFALATAFLRNDPTKLRS